MFTYLFKFLYLWLLTNFKNAYLHLLIFPAKNLHNDHITHHHTSIASTTAQQAQQHNSHRTRLQWNFIGTSSQRWPLLRSFVVALAIAWHVQFVPLRGSHVAATKFAAAHVSDFVAALATAAKLCCCLACEIAALAILAITWQYTCC